MTKVRMDVLTMSAAIAMGAIVGALIASWNLRWQLTLYCTIYALGICLGYIDKMVYAAMTIILLVNIGWVGVLARHAPENWKLFVIFTLSISAFAWLVSLAVFRKSEQADAAQNP